MSRSNGMRRFIQRTTVFGRQREKCFGRSDDIGNTHGTPKHALPLSIRRGNGRTGDQDCRGRAMNGKQS